MAADKKPKKDKKKGPLIVKLPPPVKKVHKFVSLRTEPPTTTEIAKGTGLSSKKVYQICQRFEKERFFEKDKIPRKKPVFFALIIRQTMHRGNYELITTLNTGLREIINKYKLKDPRMEADLRKFFKAILRQYPQYHEAIVSGMERLIGTIKRAKTKDKVFELLELRPSYPKVCTWKSVT
ncbi:MAG: hypothetical protein ACYSW7_10325 [Planctomycetota bacterium]|jgi:hypothetical protein